MSLFVGEEMWQEISSGIADDKSRDKVIPDSVQFSIFGTLVPEIVVPAVENRYAGSTLYLTSHSKRAQMPQH